jgi:hypothetical protein
VLGLTGAERGDTRVRPGPVRPGLLSITCLLRGLPLFFSAVPATPLRVMCIVALDTIHVLRYSRPLPRRTRIELAMFLDCQACTNAAWDRKPLRTWRTTGCCGSGWRRPAWGSGSRNTSPGFVSWKRDARQRAAIVGVVKRKDLEPLRNSGRLCWRPVQRRLPHRSASCARGAAWILFTIAIPRSG